MSSSRNRGWPRTRIPEIGSSDEIVSRALTQLHAFVDLRAEVLRLVSLDGERIVGGLLDEEVVLGLAGSYPAIAAVLREAGS